MSKYNISKEYGLNCRISYPFNKAVFTLSKPILTASKIFIRDTKYVDTTKYIIKTFDNTNIPIYLYNPKNIKTDKIMLYLHGGGFVFKGNPKQFNLCERYAKEAGIKVVFVDYRVAPKDKYPTPINDCFSAYKWIIENSKELEINPNKIIIGGDSAGGCLTIDTTLKAIRENLPSPIFNLLIYPVVDKNMSTNSMKEYQDTPVWNAKLTKKAWQVYLDGQDYTSPLEEEDLSMMPPTYVETAEFDCLHDEAILYAEKLKQAGIQVEVNETKQTMHGFDIQKCPTTENAIKKRIEVLKKIN